MSDTNPGEAGWQADPTGKHDHRYWDGSQWTDNVSDAGVASTDPYVPAAAPDVSPTDPTVTQPVAMTPPDPTSSFGAGGSPPPPVPLPADATAGGSGGSKTGLLIGAGILVIVAIIVAALAFGGGDDDPTAIDSQQSTTTTEVDSTTTTRSSEDSTTTTGLTDDTTDDTSGPIPEAVRQSIITSMEQAGLSSDQAECVVDKLIDAYRSGDVDQSDLFTRYQDFFSDCDIDPGSLGN